MSKKKRKKRRYAPPIKSRWDIFNGNVENPGEFIFIYAVLGIMFIAVFIVLLTASPKSPDDLQYASLAFCQVEIQDDDLILHTDRNDKYYSIWAYRETMTEPETFLQLCREGAVFQVGAYYVSKVKVPHYVIHSIVDSMGTVYLTPDDVFNYSYRDHPLIIAILAGLAAINFIYFCLMVYVGRNAEKFSHRTRRLFFKDGYIRCRKR